MKPSLTPILTGTILAMLAAKAAAIDVVKAANITALNNGASWVGGVVPGSSDIAVWDATVTAANNSAIGADASWLGIRIGAVGGTRHTGANVTIGDAATLKVLTLGSSGIDMSAALQALRIQSNVTLGADQTWNVANANTGNSGGGLNKGEDLTFAAGAAGAVFDGGGFTVNKLGGGIAAFGLGYTVNNANFNVNAGTLLFQSGSSRTTTLNAASSITVNTGTTLVMATESGSGGVAINSGAALTFSGGNTYNVQLNQNNALNQTGNITFNGTTTWNVTGGTGFTTSNSIFSGNLSGNGAINYNNTGTVAKVFIQLSGDNSGYTGVLTLNGAAGNRSLQLNSATAGSAAATWGINAGNTLEIAGVSVNLGILNGAGNLTGQSGASVATIGAGSFTGNVIDGAGSIGVTKTGAGTLQLLGANNFSGGLAVDAGEVTISTNTLGTGSVAVADGAKLGVNIAAAGAAAQVGDLTTGTATGATIAINTGALGNPIAPVLNAGTFTVNAATTISITGSALTSNVGSPFGVINYTGGAIGNLGFAGLGLTLPFRVSGNLVNNPGSVGVEISGVGVLRWGGTVNNDWDIDNVGNGSAGTANWSVSAGPNTYVETVSSIDSPVFDDSATGSTNVNLTTALSPVTVTVDNTAKTYTFSGPGNLTGTTGIQKQGSGTLIIANTGVNNNTGGTNIDGGTVQLGDGATAGTGALNGAITIGAGGALAINRPDDFTLSNAISGTGTLRKNAGNTVTRNVATTFAGAVEVNAGTLAFTAGGTLSGPISGVGELQAAGGTLELNGPDANAHTGMTTVSAGLLRLNKTAAVNAVSGDITITGTGQLALPSAEQIPDTATIFFTGSSTDSITTQVAMETVGNVVVNSSVGGPGGGQIIMRQGFTVLGTATVNSGIFGVASSNTATVNEIIITAAPGSNGIVRIAGNGGPSTLNILGGGITASGGEIQVKFNVNNQDAVLNLGGDFTATGNVAITNAGYTGPNLNVINLLGGDRTFDILAGTTTTVAPAVAGADDLIKTGDGTLTLNGVQNYPTLSTLAGTTNLNNILGTGTSSIFSTGTTNIAVSQTLASLDIGNGGVVVLGGPFAAPAPDFAGNADGGFGEGAVQAVPEPGGVSLLMLGAMGLLGRRRK